MAYTYDPDKLIARLRQQVAHQESQIDFLRRNLKAAHQQIEQVPQLCFSRRAVLESVRNPSEALKIIWAGDFHPSHLDAIVLAWQYGMDRLAADEPC